MNYVAYIERQKSIIRTRHEGETYLIRNGEITPVSESEKLFLELTKIRGLNTKERLFYGRAV